MTYQATGRPAGRPRKDGEPPKPRPKPAKDERKLVVVPAEERPYTVAPCCLECHPDGWPAGWTGYGCPHGVWARRL